MKRQTGLSLPELLCVVAIMAILLAIATPAFSSLRQRYALSSAAEALSQLFQFAQRRALHTGVAYEVTINGEQGCAVVVTAPGCDCAAAECRERAEYQLGAGWLTGVVISELSFAGDGMARFSPLRGAAAAGHVLLRSGDGNHLQVVVSRLGRVRLCRPVGGGEGGYPPCE